MITFETTRAKTLFDSFYSTSTSSSSENRVTDGIGYFQNGSLTFSRSYAHSNGETYIGETRGIGGGHTFGTVTASNVGGTTYGTSVNSAGSTTSITQSSRGADSATTNEYNTGGVGITTNAGTTVRTLETSTTSTIEVNLVTSSTYTDTAPIFGETSVRTVTRTGTTYFVTYLDDTDTFSYEDVFTTTAVSTYEATRTTAVTISGPYEIGTVVRAGNDRLYSFSESGGYAFPVNSFTEQTFFPDQTVLTVEFFTYGEVVPTNSYSNLAMASTVNGASISSASASFPFTSGGNIPRETTSAFGHNIGASAYTFSIGQASNSGTGTVIIEDPRTLVFDTTTVTTISAPNGLDTTTLTIAAGGRFTQAVTFTTTVFTGDPLRSIYRASSTYISVQTGSGTASAINATFASAFGVVKLSWATFNIATGVSSASGSALAYGRVPRRGGMKSPASIKQSHSTGSNVSLAASIYYPFVSSVQSNVMVPVRRNGTAVTGSTTWRYSWDSFSLYWTSKNSATSASGSGAIGVAGDKTGDVWQARGSVGGGIAPVSTAAGLVVVAPGGHKITSYDSTGGTTTAKTYISAASTTLLSSIARVEKALRVFSVSTGFAGGSSPYVTFTRNG